MPNKIIFISCGQQTKEEKALGNAVKQLIDATAGFEGYFAEYVQSLDGLANNIFENLNRCSGMVTFLQNRGSVTGKNGAEPGIRSSVWVNQEIAVLAYRRHVKGIAIPILAFKEDGVILEGAMTSLIVNPKPLSSKDEVLAKVNEWLRSTSFPAQSQAKSEIFQFKWLKVSPRSRYALQALLEEGGKNVKQGNIANHLRDYHEIAEPEIGRIITEARSELPSLNLVHIETKIKTGVEWTINSQWEDLITKELNSKPVL